MDWYIVVKTINRRRYRYRQRTWREGKKVRCESHYIGPALVEDSVVYHGTFASFEDFSDEVLGSNTGADDAREGFFFASNRLTAVSYASTQIAAQKGLTATRQAIEARVERLTGLLWWQAYQKFENDEFEDHEMHSRVKSYMERHDRACKRMGDLMARGIFAQLLPSRRATIREHRLYMQNPHEINLRGKHYDGEAYLEAIEYAKGFGHDGVIVRNVYDNNTPLASSYERSKTLTDVYIVFSATQILPRESRKVHSVG